MVVCIFWYTFYWFRVNWYSLFYFIGTESNLNVIFRFCFYFCLVNYVIVSTLASFHKTLFCLSLQLFRSICSVLFFNYFIVFNFIFITFFLQSIIVLIFWFVKKVLLLEFLSITFPIIFGIAIIVDLGWFELYSLLYK